MATGFVWKSYGLINILARIHTLPKHEGKGLGRALLSKILRHAEYPIYLHTQPSSVRAIKLYSDFGFKLVTNPIIGYRKNDLTESLPYLQKIIPEADYGKLQFAEAADALHKAALSGNQAEF